MTPADPAIAHPIIDDDDLPPLVVRSFNELAFMVIDDNAASCDLVEGILTHAAVGTVMKAPSVFAAAGMLTAPGAKIDCIICDHHMDGMTGLAFLQRIRAGKNAIVPRELPFILLTGDTTADVVQTARALDVSGLIKKPISVGAVLKSIHLALGREMHLKPAAAYSQVKQPA